MGANKQRDAGIDESDEEEDDPTLTGAGKAIKKLMNKHEKNEAYESDKDSDPYVSDVVRFDPFTLHNNLTDFLRRRKRKRSL